MSSGEKWPPGRVTGEKIDWIEKAQKVPRLEPAEEYVMRSDGTIVPRKRPYYPPPTPPKPVPKPGKRVTDLFHNGSSGRDKCSREKRCRMCQRTVGEIPESEAIRQITRHHLVPLRWFNTPRGGNFRSVRNANANIVPLCWPCHKQIEDRDMIARRMLRALLTQKEIAFAARTIGIEWLDKEYPLR